MKKHKQILISHELYEKLQALKKDDESFSDLISRLIEQTQSIEQKTSTTSTKLKIVPTFTKGEIRAMRKLLELAKRKEIPYEKLVEQLEYFITREEKAIEENERGEKA